MGVYSFLNNASEYNTPAFIFDGNAFENRAKLIKKSIGENIPLCFSIKANPFLLNCLPDVIERVEVCSPGELSICERTGIDPKRIIYSGVMKEKSDISRAVADGVGIITAESLMHVMLINEVALEAGVVMKLIARLTSGNQFGMDEKDLAEVIKNQKSYQGIELVGVHYYSGTQKKKLKNIEKDLEHLDTFLQSMNNEFNFVPLMVEYGPGLAADYFKPPYEEQDMMVLDEVKDTLIKFSEKYPMSIEMGRFLASSCGTYVTRVKDVKVNCGVNYIICDGGIHHLKYYGQTMAMQVPPIKIFSENNDGNYAMRELKEDVQNEKNWAICGSLCTVADVLVREAPLGEIKAGDILAFERCGAYSVTEGSALFLSRQIPQIYIGSEEKGFKLVRDFINSDRINCAEAKLWN